MVSNVLSLVCVVVIYLNNIVVSGLPVHLQHLDELFKIQNDLQNLFAKICSFVII